MGHVGQEDGFRPARALGLLLGDAQGPLRGVPRGHVSYNADEDPLASGPRFAHRELHGEGRPVLASAFHLAADADDAAHPRAAITGEILVVLFPVGGGHEHANVLADHLVRPVAEEALAGGVVFLHPAQGVDDDHPVDRRLDQGLEPLFPVFERPRGLPVGHDQQCRDPEDRRLQAQFV